MRDLTLILPTRNEAIGLKHTLGEIEAQWGHLDILVVDTNSTDGTLGIAEKYGVRIINENRRGKGLAIETGLKNTYTQYAIMMDSDFSYLPIDLIGIYNALIFGYDLVLGYRRYKQGNSMSFTHKMGNWGLSNLCNILYFSNLKDICTGMKGFNMDKWGKVDLTSPGFEVEAEIVAKAIKRGFRIEEVPIGYRERIGQSKLGGFGAGSKIALKLVEEWVR